MLYCEDPGAANFMVGLPARLSKSGLAATLYASGAASDFLVQRGESVAQLAANVLDGVSLIAVGTSENPESPAFALVVEARQRGIPSVGIVDTEANAPFRFRGQSDDPLAFVPDRLAVADEATAAAFRSLGFPAARIDVCGHPHFDRAIAARRQLEARGRAAVRAEVVPAAGARPVVTFLAEQPLSLDPAGTVDADETAFPGPRRRRVDAVLDSVIAALRGLDGPPYLVLRLHPKNTREEFAVFAGRVDLVSAGGDPLPLLFCADLVVGLTTALLAEAAVLGRPVLPVAACAGDRDWLPRPLRDGRRPIAESAADVSRLVPAGIDGHLVPPAPPDPLALGGDSLSRLAAFLQDHVDKKRSATKQKAKK